MEELKDRYEIIEETASDAIVTLDEPGRILSISRAAASCVLRADATMSRPATTN